MTAMLQDVRYAVRSLLRERRSSIAIVAILAVALGLSIAVSALVSAILIAPLPYPDADRLVRIYERKPSAGIERSAVSRGNFADWRRDLKSFEAIEAFEPQPRDTIIQIDRDPEIAREASVTSGFMGMLGIKPLVGSEDGLRLSYRYWKRRFGRDPAVVGRRVIYEGFTQQPLTITGIMPELYDLPAGAEFWSTMSFEAQRGARNLDVVGRLKSGITLEQAQSELDAMSNQLAKQYPADNAGWSAVAVPLKSTIVGPVRTPLALLYISVSLLLLIAALNVGVLFTAKRLRRRKDLSVQIALGASRARLARQALIECGSLSILGLLTGTAIAWGLLRLLMAFAPSSMPRLVEVHLSFVVLTAAALSAVLVTALMWVVSVFRTRISFAVLRSATATGSGGPYDRMLRFGLLGAEIAGCACLLLVSAGTVRSFVQLERSPLGFDPDGILTIDVRQPIFKPGEHITHYPDRRFVQTAERLAAYAATLPGSAGAAIAYNPPLLRTPLHRRYLMLDGIRTGPLTGTLPVAGPEVRQADLQIVDPSFFEVTRIPLLSGRSFTHSDRLDNRQIDDFDADRGAGAAIVSQSFAKQYGSTSAVLGRYISIAGTSYRSLEIVGVAANVASGMGQPPVATIYVPFAQLPFDRFTLLVRTAAPSTVAARLTAFMRTQLGTDVSAFNDRKYSDIVALAVAAQRFSSRVMSAFGVIALAFSGIALYSVLAFVVISRKRELAIRLTLGADPQSLLIAVLGKGMRLSAVGAAAGLLAGILLLRLLKTALPNISGATAMDVMVTGVLMLVAGAAASYWPARCAAGVDPLPLLKSE